MDMTRQSKTLSHICASQYRLSCSKPLNSSYVQYKYTIIPQKSVLLIAPLSILRRPQLVHLLDTLLKLHILALFIRMSLVLIIVSPLVSPIFIAQIHPPVPSLPNASQSGATHLALPRQVIRLISTPIQRDQQIGTAVAVGKG